MVLGEGAYFRLCVARADGRRHLQTGFLRAAGRLQASGALSPEDDARLRETLRWFDRHLPAPKRLGRVHALFWFKADALGDRPDLKLNIAALVQVLTRAPCRVALVRTARPGKVVYEDPLQVGAVPFTETFRDATVIPVTAPGSPP